MTNIPQIQKGFAAFIDNQVACAYTGVEKALVLAAGTLIAANFPNLIKMYGNHPVVSALGVYNAESGTVDVDAIYKAFVPQLGDEKIPVTLPKIGKMNLGTLKFGKEDLDALYRYIKEA